MDISFPLRERILNRGCAEHIAAGLGCAADYRAVYVDLFSPVDGKVYLFNEYQGGNWIQITDSLGRKWEMAHLSKRLVKAGDTVKHGQKIGVTGNTGHTTTGPHLHLQIIVGYPKRIDPEPLLINAPLPMSYEQYNEKIIRSVGGAYALVIRGKKYEIKNIDVAAIITWMQRNHTGNFENNVPNDVFNNIPTSNGLQF